MKTKNWYTSKEISEICRVSTRTIERKRNKLLKLNPKHDWFKMGSKPYKYSIKMMHKFLSPTVFELIKRNRQLANTISCIHRTDSLEQHLSFLDWDYFVTISYKDNLNKKKCYSAMFELNEMMEASSFGNDTRMFFTTEPFADRRGYHSHLIIKMGGTPDEVKRFIKTCAPIGRTHVERYDPELAGIFYVCKKGRIEEDWDLFGNNLGEEGERLLKKLRHLK